MSVALLVGIGTAQTSSLTEVAPFPSENLGFVEDTPYRFPRPGEGFALIIDDEEIEAHKSQDGWHWSWRPGFYAGAVQVELVGPDRQTVAQYRLDVAPSPGKIGQELFDAMIAEIEAHLPELLPGSEPASRSIGREGYEAGDLLQFSRLRHYANRCRGALSAALARPRTQIGSTRKQMPLHRIRRIDSLAAHQVARAAPWLAPAIDDKSLHDPRNIGQGLSIASYQLDLDSSANRAIKALVEALRRRSRQLERSFLKMLQQPDPGGARSDIRSRLPRRVEFLAGFTASMSQMLREAPLIEVTRAEVSAAGLNAVSADPAYAHAYRLGRRALGLGVAGAPEHMSWLSPTWEIYERWCYLGLMSAINRLFPGAYPERESRPDCNATAQHTWHAGQLTIQLVLQPRIPSGDQRPSAGFLSVSGPREPDIVLRATSISEDKFIVFDAKYRVSRQNVLDAMGSAHIYRDALRLKGKPPRLSCLLVPKAGGAPWLESEEFHVETGVGVIPFSPGACRDTLMRRLGQFFASGDVS